MSELISPETQRFIAAERLRSELAPTGFAQGYYTLASPNEIVLEDTLMFSGSSAVLQARVDGFLLSQGYKRVAKPGKSYAQYRRGRSGGSLFAMRPSRFPAIVVLRARREPERGSTLLKIIWLVDTRGQNLTRHEIAYWETQAHALRESIAGNSLSQQMIDASEKANNRLLWRMFMAPLVVLCNLFGLLFVLAILTSNPTASGALVFSVVAFALLLALDIVTLKKVTQRVQV